MDTIVHPGSVDGTVSPPCSKSYAQRVLAAALLARGETVVDNLTMCDDTRAALRCIRALGARVHELSERTCLVRGGLDPRSQVLEVGESGLATRLFTPIASLACVPVTVVGEGTMLHRPVGMMVFPLRELGVEVLDGGGLLPIRVKGPLHGGEVHVDGSISSQFLTGLLLALPLADSDTEVHVKGLVSTPYVDMTIETARMFGVRIERDETYTEFYVPAGQRYEPASVHIEADWSSAASLLVAGAVAGTVSVENLSRISLQADTAVVRPLLSAGAEVISTDDSVTVTRRSLRAFEFDATHAPDLFPALAALAANCKGVSTITGTERLRDKESNRAAAIAEEYGKLGIDVDISEPDVMRIRGGRIRGGRVESHGDHRIAMSLAVAALNASEPVVIENAESVAKSYPAFFNDLYKIRTADR